MLLNYEFQFLAATKVQHINSVETHRCNLAEWLNGKHFIHNANSKTTTTAADDNNVIICRPLLFR